MICRPCIEERVNLLRGVLACTGLLQAGPWRSCLPPYTPPQIFVFLGSTCLIALCLLLGESQSRTCPTLNKPMLLIPSSTDISEALSPTISLKMPETCCISVPFNIRVLEYQVSGTSVAAATIWPLGVRGWRYDGTSNGWLKYCYKDDELFKNRQCGNAHHLTVCALVTPRSGPANPSHRVQIMSVCCLLLLNVNKWGAATYRVVTD